jgi:tetratricopeptide (TPR) repeat protein
VTSPRPGRRLVSLAEKQAKTIGHLEAYGLLARLEPEDRTRMLHLLNCRDCQRRARRELVERIEEQLAATAPEAKVPPGSAESLERHLADILAGRVVAERLLALPAAERRAAIDADESYRQPTVGLVLVMSAGSFMDDPASALEHGELALDILSRELEAGWKGEIALRLEALGILIVARLQLDELEEAEASYRLALPLLRRRAPSSGPRGSVLAACARLRWAQGRLDEAVALFGHAAASFVAALEPQGEAACRLQAGVVLLDLGELRRARSELALAWSRLDSQRAPELGARTALLLAYCCVVLGRLSEASTLVEEARRLYPRAADRGEEAFRTWWEGRIAGQRGQRREADSRLDSVRRLLLAEGSLVEAASYTLELLLFRVESSRFDEVKGLGRDLAAAFGGTALAERCGEAIEALADQAALGSPQLESAVAATRELFEALRPDGARRNLIFDLQTMAARWAQKAAAESDDLAAEIVEERGTAAT